MRLTKLMILIGALGLLVMSAGPAAAYLINFDNLTPQVTLNGNIEGVNLGGVTITSALNDTTVVSPTTGTDFGVGWRSPFNAVTNNTFITANPMTLTFDVPQSSITVTGGDRGGDTDQFTVTAYDSSNTVLGTVTTPIFGGTTPLNPNVMVDFFTVSLNFPGMKSVVVSNAINAGIGLDNITFCNIPAPSTWLLFGSGLVGLWGFKRRKFWK
jgi:hypothetical protein